MVSLVIETTFQSARQLQKNRFHTSYYMTHINGSDIIRNVCLIKLSLLIQKQRYLDDKGLFLFPLYIYLIGLV